VKKTNGVEKQVSKVTNKIAKVNEVIKAKGKTKVEKTPRKTISSLVLNEFKTNPSIKSKDMIELVKKFNPQSKFNVYHFCWYRYQIKKGRYNKQFDKQQLAKIFTSK
jgi:hypothetical protein